MTDEWTPESDRERMYHLVSLLGRREKINAGEIEELDFDRQIPDWLKDTKESA